MTLSSDQTWKVFTTLLAVLVVPLAGWVWSMNVEVAQLRNDMGDLEGIVADIDRHSDIGMDVVDTNTAEWGIWCVYYGAILMNFE